MLQNQKKENTNGKKPTGSPSNGRTDLSDNSIVGPTTGTASAMPLKSTFALKNKPATKS